MLPFDLQALLLTILGNTLDVLLTFANGAIPALIVAWLVDTILRFVPFLKPFREAIKQFILARIEELRLKRAQRAVLAAGQKYKAEVKQLTADRGEPPPQTVIAALKQRRLNEAMDSTRKIAGAEQARDLVEAAVATLKREAYDI
jgi:hypothetical protein